MARSQGELTVRRCRPAAHNSFSDADNTAEPIAVGLSGSSVGTEPSVIKATGGVYGLFESYQDNGETSTTAVGERRVGVITGGIVRFKADSAVSDADVGKGIVADTTTQAGDVKAGDAATTLGRGSIVGVETVGSNHYVWVDLDANPTAPNA